MDPPRTDGSSTQELPSESLPADGLPLHCAPDCVYSSVSGLGIGFVRRVLSIVRLSSSGIQLFC